MDRKELLDTLKKAATLVTDNEFKKLRLYEELLTEAATSGKHSSVATRKVLCEEIAKINKRQLALLGQTSEESGMIKRVVKK